MDFRDCLLMIHLFLKMEVLGATISGCSAEAMSERFRAVHSLAFDFASVKIQDGEEATRWG